MKNKKILVVSIIFIFIMVGSVIGYKYLTKDYNNMSISDKYESNNDNKIKSKDFKVFDVDGKEVKSLDYEGKKAVVINFWASWCPPCKYEMPYFKNANSRYKNEDVEILMINLTDGKRETKESAIKYMKDNGYDMKLLLDEELSAASEYQVQGIPRSIFIDKDGYIVKDITGAIEEDELYKNIDDLI
ncbi:MAG: TlpA disulfide reductase family protein [Romboutsia sp.]